MAHGGHCRVRVLALAMALVTGVTAVICADVIASPDTVAAAPPDFQKRRDLVRKRKQDPGTDAVVKPGATAPGPVDAAPEPPSPKEKEKVEADVSTRSIAITSGFTGTEIVVFGSVDNSRQSSAEAGYYDVVVVVEGTPTPLLARKKANVAGLWVNTDAAAFEGVPSYYAVAATRPIEEIADAATLERNAIGLDYIRLAPAAKSALDVSPPELKGFRDAVVRLKQRDGLYIKADYAVAFVGRGLFRSKIGLPPNVPVGPLTARIYLFREGELLSTYSTRVKLEREGIERWLYRFAMQQALLYGLAAVVLAGVAGFAASSLFTRTQR